MLTILAIVGRQEEQIDAEEEVEYDQQLESIVRIKAKAKWISILDQSRHPRGWAETIEIKTIKSSNVNIEHGLRLPNSCCLVDCVCRRSNKSGVCLD